MSTFAERVDATTISDLVGRGSCKWTTYPGAIGAWVAEMDFGVADPVTEALDRMEASYLYGYASQTMLANLRAAASGFCGRRYGWEVDPDSVVVLSDVLHALGLVLDGYLAPDAPVVLLTPCYMPFMTLPPAHDRRIVQVPMVPSAEGWETDLDALGRALAGGGLLVLASPFNPLGKVFTRDELMAITEVVDAAGARVFADEIHAPLTFPGFQHVPYASISETAARHSITAISASKAWNLAGLKCAQLVFTNPDDQDLWRRRVARRATEASNPGILAGTAAYDEGGPWLEDALAYLEVNRRLIVDGLRERLPGVRLNPLQGTYLQFVDCRDLGLGENPQKFFLREARVAITDGDLCGDAGRGYVRINIGTPTPILREIIDRMGNAVERAR